MVGGGRGVGRDRGRGDDSHRRTGVRKAMGSCLLRSGRGGRGRTTKRQGKRGGGEQVQKIREAGEG